MVSHCHSPRNSSLLRTMVCDSAENAARKKEILLRILQKAQLGFCRGCYSANCLAFCLICGLSATAAQQENWRNHQLLQLFWSGMLKKCNCASGAYLDDFLTVTSVTWVNNPVRAGCSGKFKAKTRNQIGINLQRILKFCKQISYSNYTCE